MTAGILVADIVLALTEEFPSEELLRGGDAPRLRDALPVYVGIRVGVAACREGAAELVDRRGATVIGCSADIVGIFEPGAPFLAGDALDLAGEVPALVGVLDGDDLALAGDPLPLSTRRSLSPWWWALRLPSPSTTSLGTLTAERFNQKN